MSHSHGSRPTTPGASPARSSSAVSLDQRPVLDSSDERLMRARLDAAKADAVLAAARADAAEAARLVAEERAELAEAQMMRSTPPRAIALCADASLRRSPASAKTPGDSPLPGFASAPSSRASGAASVTRPVSVLTGSVSAVPARADSPLAREPSTAASLGRADGQQLVPSAQHRAPLVSPVDPPHRAPRQLYTQLALPQPPSPRTAGPAEQPARLLTPPQPYASAGDGARTGSPSGVVLAVRARTPTGSRQWAASGGAGDSGGAFGSGWAFAGSEDEGENDDGGAASHGRQRGRADEHDAASSCARALTPEPPPRPRINRAGALVGVAPPAVYARAEGSLARAPAHAQPTTPAHPGGPVPLPPRERAAAASARARAEACSVELARKLAIAQRAESGLVDAMARGVRAAELRAAASAEREEEARREARARAARAAHGRELLAQAQAVRVRGAFGARAALAEDALRAHRDAQLDARIRAAVRGRQLALAP
ncbi:hypothetical protein KFE25_011644 [Diacronema lutheri]|uniref:Uncharacterized protein n=1 Tax=Diacronema lutheri TaxID=2081491 RepID=A0A8J5XD45_DIALT|nr:hypothetical protein KFE25_011644 [Diacronema lutheri]